MRRINGQRRRLITTKGQTGALRINSRGYSRNPAFAFPQPRKRDAGLPVTGFACEDRVRTNDDMKRLGMTLGLRPGCLDEYRRIHVKLWPEIEGAIHTAGLQNFSIYHHDGMLFSYFEYVGPEEEFASRMQVLADAPRMREWWAVTEPLQVPRTDRQPGEWWTTMEEVFHLD